VTGNKNLENRLDLQDLCGEPGLPGLTSAAGRYLAESAAVCLASQSHQPGTTLRVEGIVQRELALVWSQVTPQMERAYNDLQEATEAGACAVAILLIRESLGLTVVRRSRKGSGVDYWLGPGGTGDVQEPLAFQQVARLEVSGILQGTQSQTAARLKQKQAQTRRSHDTWIPAYVVVVEFGGPRALVGEIHASADQPTP